MLTGLINLILIGAIILWILCIAKDFDDRMRKK